MQQHAAAAVAAAAAAAVVSDQPHPFQVLVSYIRRTVCIVGVIISEYRYSESITYHYWVVRVGMSVHNEHGIALS